jgi:hypothetical protein
MRMLIRILNNKAFLVVLGAIIGGGMSLLGSFIVQHYSYQNNIELQQKNLRETSFAQLSGLQVVLRQAYVSRFEALIYSDYHEYKYYYFSNNSIDFEEAKRWMIKSEDYVDVITKAWQDVYSCFAEIKISYEITPEIDQLINILRHYKNPEIKTPLKGQVQINSLQELESWKGNAVNGMNDLSMIEYDIPLQQLLTALEKQLK